MHLTYDMYDITLSDIKRGSFKRRGKTHRITDSVKTIRQCRVGQLFKLPTTKGEITDTFSSSSTARDYNRVWLKSTTAHTGSRARAGKAILVPYDDPNGEIMYVELTQKVLAFNVLLNEDFT